MKQQWEPPELEEMQVVILSLHQKWWQKMAAGEKVLELRKTKPQCKAPFRVLVYVTGGAGVLGEFICPEVLEIKNFEEAEKKSKVPAHDIHNYAAGSRNKVYGCMVTGSASYRRYTGSYSRRKKRGCDCTEVEAAEITLYFNFYKEELKREMEAFMAGFKFKNNLFPDENARCYQEHKGEERERTDEENRMLKKAAFFADFMDGNKPPRALIGEPEEED